MLDLSKYLDLPKFNALKVITSLKAGFSPAFLFTAIYIYDKLHL